MQISTRDRLNSSLNSAFEIIERLLYGINFEVFLQHYFVGSSESVNNLHNALKFALKKENIDLLENKSIEAEEISLNIEECLLYEGMEHSRPLLENISSMEFKENYNLIRTQIINLCNNATRLESFVLGDLSHPVYPVYWDFAYAIYTKDGIHIIIGSSSD